MLQRDSRFGEFILFLVWNGADGASASNMLDLVELAEKKKSRLSVECSAG
jgi:hypothetical protein